MPTVEEMRQAMKRYEETTDTELNKSNENLSKENKPNKPCDHPNTMENSTATVLWIVIMIVGSIFKGSLIIWIISTIIWLRFIMRHMK